MSKNYTQQTIRWQDIEKPIPPMETGRVHHIHIQREVIPLVFVPGIMGSRLRNKSTKKIVWEPESDGWMVQNYYKLSAAERHGRLIGGSSFEPSFLEVVANREDWEAKVGDDTSDFESLRETGSRGFEGVSFGSYRNVLEALFNREKDPASGWSSDIRKRFQLPVYSCGYNWTASNQDAGDRLALLVNNLIKAYVAAGRTCRHVILITHSMGGLVARAALKLNALEPRVLGIIHGVQPVNGAPAAYWRMKAGFERSGLFGPLGANVLGRSAPEVTALLGHMPGGLQLLPNKRYLSNAGGKTWLHILDPSGEVPLKSLPVGSDPYKSIYLEKDAFWRLIDASHLRPCGDQQTKSCKLPPAKDLSPWEEYERILKIAEKFHDDLGDYKHPCTRSFSGTGDKHLTADRIRFRPDRYYLQNTLPGGWIWQGPTTAQQVCAVMDQTYGIQWEYEPASFSVKIQGALSTMIPIRLLPADGKGDGTVPESSAHALELPFVEEVPPVKRGQSFEPCQLGFPALEHEPAYKDNFFWGTSDPLKFVFNSIESLCHDLIRQEGS